MAMKNANTLLPVSQSRQDLLLKLEQEFQPDHVGIRTPSIPKGRERADSTRPSSLYGPSVLPDTGPSLEELTTYRVRKAKPPLHRRNSKQPNFPAISEIESDVPDYTATPPPLQKRPTTLSILESEESTPGTEKRNRVKFSPKTKPSAPITEKQPKKSAIPFNKKKIPVDNEKMPDTAKFPPHHRRKGTKTKTKYTESGFDADDEGIMSPRVSFSQVHDHESPELLKMEVLADVHVSNDLDPTCTSTSFIISPDGSYTTTSPTSGTAKYTSQVTSPLSHTPSLPSNTTSPPSHTVSPTKHESLDHQVGSGRKKRPLLMRVLSVDMDEPPDAVTGQTMRNYDIEPDVDSRVSIQQNSRTKKTKTNELFLTGLQESNLFVQFSEKESSGGADVKED